MKTLIILSFLISTTSFASESICNETSTDDKATQTMNITTDVPVFLKGATITVRLADGKESTVPAEKFKVVARKQEFIVTKIEHKTVIGCTKTEYKEIITNIPKKNRVSLSGGYGIQKGLDSYDDGSTISVESKLGLVGGAQYQRMLDDDWSVGLQLQTNQTTSVMVGLDF